MALLVKQRRPLLARIADGGSGKAAFVYMDRGYANSDRVDAGGYFA